MYDIIIIGAGPAGMSAAIYAARYKLKIAIIGELVGGMMSEAYEICNYPGYKKILGRDLTQKMQEQVKGLGVQIINQKVKEVKKSKLFEVKADKIYKAKKVILAAGSIKNKLGLKNEERLIGKGVSYCATCDGAFFKEKIVGIIGGSNSALTAALMLANHAKKVFIIYRRDKFFRPIPAWVEQVKKNNKITTLFNAEVKELIGEKKLEAVKLKDGKEMKLDGLFIEIGSKPNLEIIKGLKVELDKGRIKVDDYRRTKIPGLFAAGDICNTPLQQIITAAADGAIAAKTAFDEINGAR